MSNFLAVATVTATLSDLLQSSINPDVPGATVTTLRPDGNGGMPSTGVNVFLYQVTPNPGWQNEDLPTRRAGGDLVQRPQAALDLNYLLTFYGADAQLEPQRALGSVVRTLRARPVLTRDMIRQTLSKAAFAFLSGSNLADAVELVKFTPLPLSLEELSKLWSVYFQTQYSLSIAYQGTVVLIESEEPARAALPVRTRNLYVVPFRKSIVEEVRSSFGAGSLILPGSTVVILGQRLRGETTEVRVGGLTSIPPLEDVSDTQITLVLPAGVHAGVQGLQVIHPRLMGTPPLPHRGVESNLAPFVLHPVIRKKSDGTPDVGISGVVATGDMRAANLTVRLDPNVAKSQRAVLFLNELNAPSSRASRAYSFDAVPRNQPADPPETDTVTFPITGVFTGDYLVRLQIDGADSPLEQDPNAPEPLFIGPKVTIS